MPKPRYIGERGEQRLLDQKDLAGLYYVAQMLLDQAPPEEFVYVGLGRSPAVLMGFMQRFFGLKVYELPLSIEENKQDYQNKVRHVPYTPEMRAFIERYLPWSEIGERGVVLVDYADSGYSINSAYELMLKHLDSRGWSDPRQKVFIAPLTEIATLIDDERSKLRGFDPNTKGTHRLLKILMGAFDKEDFAHYERHAEQKALANVPAKIVPGARERLSYVLDCAVELMGGVDGALQMLPQSEYHAARSRPWRTLEIVRNGIAKGDAMRPAKVVIKEHLISHYQRKSAQAYGVPRDWTSYQFQRAVTTVRQHPREAGGVAAVLFAFVCYVLFVYVAAIESS